jgi:vanillate O-demethylase ferredoxin subunit
MSNSSLNVKVVRKVQEATDISTFELVDAEGGRLPAFTAGAHIDVYLSCGMTRQYSLCNDPREDNRYVIAVLKDPATRGGSKAMHDMVHEGDELRISSPKNHFPLTQGSKRSLLIAGGIGITPILSMAERLAALGEEFELHYCTRSQERTAFLSHLSASSFAERVIFHFDDGGAQQKADLPTLLAKPGICTHLYVCGPKGFMDAVLGNARAQGWLETQIHYEFFGANIVKSEDDQSFQVKLASSGRIVWVQKDKTVVEALVEVGVDILTSCGEGVCGTCLTRVLEGECDHKDSYLLPDEQARHDQFLPCCSRARSSMLVLDL